MSGHGVFPHHFVEIHASTSLKLVNHIHYFGVLQDCFHFRIMIDCLHGWVIFHFLFFLFLLSLCNFCKMTTHETTEFHKKFFKLRIVAILLHSFLRLGTHLCQNFDSSRILECSAKTWTLHYLLHKVCIHPLILCFLKTRCDILLNFFEA